jgi:hypothetical protein
LLAKLIKNILRGVNFTNLKISGGYIAKSKPQGVCLQLSQTPRVDYVIWPFYGNLFGLILNVFTKKKKKKSNGKPLK